VLLLILCELAPAPAAGRLEPDRLLHLIWRHATVTDGLEHLHARAGHRCLRLAAFLRCRQAHAGPQALRRLVRRALDREPELHHWHLIDDPNLTYPTDRGAEHP
jgi:hypothetical protein